jgi:hypothetical protein
VKLLPYAISRIVYNKAIEGGPRLYPHREGPAMALPLITDRDP